MRRVFEALVGGILLADSPGFLDQCEKELMDMAIELTNHERKDITIMQRKKAQTPEFYA